MARGRAAWTEALSSRVAMPVVAPSAPARRMKQSTALAAIARSVAKKPSQSDRLQGYLREIERMEEVDAKIPDRQVIQIVPVPKPRMSQRDAWEKRPTVQRYRAFCDEIRLKGAKLPHAYRLLFVMPMPESWPEEYRSAMNGKPCLLKPDASNLVKATEDALCRKDECLHNIGAIKRWGFEGRIEIIKVSQDYS